MTSFHRLLRFALLILGLAFGGIVGGGCTTIGVTMNAEPTVNDPKPDGPIQGDVEYVTSVKTYGHAAACFITGLLYGGWCWMYFAMPFDYQSREVRREAMKALDLKMGVTSTDLRKERYSKSLWYFQDDTLRLSPELSERAKRWKDWLNRDFDELVEAIGEPKTSVVHSEGRTLTLALKNSPGCIVKVVATGSDRISAIDVEAPNRKQCRENFPSPIPYVAPVSDEISGGLTNDEVQGVIKANIGQIRDCYDLLLERNKEAKGKMKARWEISGEGFTTKPRIILDSLGDEKIRTCVLTKLKSWSWPKPRGGVSVKIFYPFVFSNVVEAK